MATPINYLEIPVTDMTAAKQFYSTVFAWKFDDYGEFYSVFSNAGVMGGFYLSEKTMQTADGSALVVLHTKDLAAAQQTIRDNGGQIVVETFSFPGGSRFHFTDVCGNELAVWSDADSEQTDTE